MLQARSLSALPALLTTEPVAPDEISSLIDRDQLEHAFTRLSVEHRAEILSALRELAEQSGAPDPQTLADRVLLIVDGVYANGALLGSQGASAAAVEFAREVVRAAVPLPGGRDDG